MAQKFYKYKLLLDEGFHLRQHLPLLNNLFNVRHVAADFKKSGLKDPQVYALACKENRLIITYNIKDFKKLVVQSSQTGIIGVSPNLLLEQIDKKLTALLRKAKPVDLFGKFTIITG